MTPKIELKVPKTSNKILDFYIKFDFFRKKVAKVTPYDLQSRKIKRAADSWPKWVNSCCFFYFWADSGEGEK